VAAARAKRHAGALAAALGLLVAVEARPLDALRTARRRLSRAPRFLHSRAMAAGSADPSSTTITG
jgi:hypothetical protein